MTNVSALMLVTAFSSKNAKFFYKMASIKNFTTVISKWYPTGKLNGILKSARSRALKFSISLRSSKDEVASICIHETVLSKCGDLDSYFNFTFNRHFICQLNDTETIFINNFKTFNQGTRLHQPEYRIAVWFSMKHHKRWTHLHSTWQTACLTCECLNVATFDIEKVRLV